MRYIIRVLSISFLLLLLMPFGVQAANEVLHVRVTDQVSFDRLTKSIEKGIADGYTNIRVDFVKNTYYFKDAQINIGNKHAPTVSITIDGNDAVFRPQGTLLKGKGDKAVYKAGCSYLDANGSDIYNYSKTYQSDATVEVLDVKAKTCRIKCGELDGVRSGVFTNARIDITTWYTRMNCQVQKIENGYVYFIADKLEPGMGRYGDYNVNYDYTVGSLNPRFRLSNVAIGGCPFYCDGEYLVSDMDEDVYQCEESLLLQIMHSSFNQVIIKRMIVQGNTSACPLMMFNDNKVNTINVTGCEFSSIRALAIFGRNTDNITVEKCSFHDNYTTVMMFENDCANVRVTKNKFERIAYLTNSFCIKAHGANYKIDHNEISDFGYGAIGVGNSYGNKNATKPCYGVVERNHIYHTADFKANKQSRTLIDGGAIYVYTCNDGAVLCYNYVHDICGMGAIRGIYCDDGTTNCSVYGNIVMNIENSYGIDLRKSLVLDNLGKGKSNVNNKIHDNIFNNKFRFEGRGDDSTSVKGRNYIVVDTGGEIPEMNTSSLVETNTDYVVHYSARKIERKAIRMLRKK